MQGNRKQGVFNLSILQKKGGEVMSTYEVLYLIITSNLLLISLLSLVIEIVKLLKDNKHEKK